MRVAVCDDNKKFRESIAQWIQEYNKIPCTVSIFANGEGLCREAESYDVIFLDIDMDGMNGIETARRIRRMDKSVKIIYVTSYSDYVDGAFSIHAFSYILKPVTKSLIFKQLDEILSYTLPKRHNPEIEFQTEHGLERFTIDEIYYFEYCYRKIIIYTQRGQFTFRGKITEVLNNMSQYGFATPHKSFVVNLHHVKSIKGYELTMMNGEVVPLSQKKSPMFRKQHSGYLTDISEGVGYE